MKLTKKKIGIIIIVIILLIAGFIIYKFWPRSSEKEDNLIVYGIYRKKFTANTYNQVILLHDGNCYVSTKYLDNIKGNYNCNYEIKDNKVLLKYTIDKDKINNSFETCNYTEEVLKCSWEFGTNFELYKKLD